MSVENVTERLAQEMLDENEVKGILTCHCQQCRDDVLAIALNQLPPRYVSTHQGGVYVKANYLHPQLQSDILGELIRAAQLVSEHPHHLKDDAGEVIPDVEADS